MGNPAHELELELGFHGRDFRARMRDVRFGTYDEVYMCSISRFPGLYGPAACRGTRAASPVGHHQICDPKGRCKSCP